MWTMKNIFFVFIYLGSAEAVLGSLSKPWRSSKWHFLKRAAYY